jgi:hypothetical protein
MITIEQRAEHVDEIVQQVINTWGMYTQTGHNQDLTPEFRKVFELACQYRDAKRLADNHREFNMLSERGRRKGNRKARGVRPSL